MEIEIKTKEKKCLRLFISFWAIIFYVLPVILAVLLRFKILPDIFNYGDREMTLFEMCKYIVCSLLLQNKDVFNYKCIDKILHINWFIWGIFSI